MPRLTTVLSCRLPTPEAVAIRRIAAAQGRPVSHVIRDVLNGHPAPQGTA